MVLRSRRRRRHAAGLGDAAITQCRLSVHSRDRTADSSVDGQESTAARLALPVNHGPHGWGRLYVCPPRCHSRPTSFCFLAPYAYILHWSCHWPHAALNGSPHETTRSPTFLSCPYTHCDVQCRPLFCPFVCSGMPHCVCVSGGCQGAVWARSGRCLGPTGTGCRSTFKLRKAQLYFFSLSPTADSLRSAYKYIVNWARLTN